MLKLTGIGFIAAMHWVTFYGSIKYANVSVALVCFSSVGFFTALMEPLILREKMKWVELLLGLLVIAGIYIIFHFDTQYKTGIILGVISAVLLAFVMIIFRQFVQRINPETVLTYQLSGGVANTYLLLCHFTCSSFPLIILFRHRRLDVAAGAFMVLFRIGFSAFSHALKRLSAFTVNLTFNLEPVYGIILAFVVFGESKDLSNGLFFGLALIAASLIIHIIIIAKRRKKN